MNIFPDLSDIEVEEVEVAEEITLTLRTMSPTASCPSCGTASSRIQSRYTRTLRDLPSVGRPIRLILHVRRFFCKKEHLCSKDLRRTPSRTLPSSCATHETAAKSPLRAWTQGTHGMRNEVKASRQRRNSLLMLLTSGESS